MKQESKKIISELKNEKKKNKGKNDSDSLNYYIDSEKEIQRVNLKIITNVENQKLILREKLVVAIKHIIWFQLVFFNIIILIIVLAVTSKAPFFKDIDIELSIRLFDFLKYYISATIVELLGMLVFILHYVFSKFSWSEILLKRNGQKEVKNDTEENENIND